jgi:hypothetical protein
VIGREKDFQPFSAVACMHIEGKHAEAILLAYMEIGQPREREVGDDTSILGLRNP